LPRSKKYQAITLLCALGFLGIKSYEYHDKFTHYEVIKNDGEIVDGHLKEKTKDHVVILGHVVEKDKGEAHGGVKHERSTS